MTVVLAATGAAFYAAAAFLILVGVTAGLIVRFRKRPAGASPPRLGSAPAPGPATSAGPPPSEMTERRSPRPPVVPAPGSQFTHGRRIYTIRKYEDGSVYYWDANENMAMVVKPIQDADFDEWLKGLTS